MKVIVACLLLAAFSAVTYGQTLVSNGQIVRNQVLNRPGDTNVFSLTGNNPLQNITYFAFPCLGSFNIFLGSGFIPNVNRSLQAVYSANDTVASFIGAEALYVRGNQSAYAAIRATSTGHNNVPANSNNTILNSAAIFDIYSTIFSDNVTFTERIPFLYASVTNYGRNTDAGIGYITYPVSTNPLDSYSYWRYNGTYNYDQTGYISATACGARLFMEPAYPTSTRNNNDGTRTVEFAVPFNEPGFQYHSFVVIVSRNCASLGYDCFDGVFQRVDISGSVSIITPSWVAVLFFAAFLMLLF
eukprot:TRINITY_DN8504_c0_g1_i1.p1 TRINITY_DN8504_c0_g1~~TRINITY_DN8504_c0_g1_i1.p1  ORF type:complete len:300 (-),score=30.20 TRINITY_DN8504_c0_g1_i1:52-951(-)